MTTARDLSRTDKRARILDAAVRVFASRGFFTATVAEIARAAGVADGTIYLYFESKDALLLALFDEKLAELAEAQMAALARQPDAPARLFKFVTLHLQLVEKHPELAQVLIVELRAHAHELKQKGLDRKKLAAYLGLVEEIVRAGQAAGEFVSDLSPQAVKRAVFGALDEIALGWLVGGRKTNLKKLGQEVARLFVRGLLPEKAMKKEKST